MTQAPPLRTLIAYGLPGLPLAALSLPVYVYLPTVYAETFGLGLATTGLVLLFARLWDGLTDPLVGIFSDATGGRFGRRRIWAAAGAPLVLLATWRLFMPPDDVTAVHLGVWSALLYAGWTMVILPLRAWGAELSTDYHARSRIAGVREGFVMLGSLLGLLVAGLVEQQAGAAAGLRAIGWLVLASLPPAMLALILLVPDPPHPAPPPARLQAMLALWRNVSFRRLLIADLINSTANGLPATLFLTFVATVLQAEGSAGLLLVAYFAAGIVGVPIWLALGRRRDKHHVWMVAMLWNCAVFAIAPWLGPGDVWPFAIVSVLSGLALGADLTLPASMYADAVDRGLAEGGEPRAGLYFAMTSLATKLALALAVGIAFPLLERADGAAWAVIALYAVVPIGLKLLAIAIMARHDLTRARLAELQAIIPTTETRP